MEAIPSSSGSVVIIGAGFAGLMTALSLSSYRMSSPIILIEPRRRFVFSPLLYELLSNEIQSWEIAPTYKSLIAGKGISLVQDSIEKIDVTDNYVFTSSGEAIKYDQLVVCTGSKPTLRGIPGALENALTFSQLDDVAKLNKVMGDLKTSGNDCNTLAIVGAGPSGVELACKVSDLLDGKIQINLIELGDKVLPESKSFNQEQALIALNKRNVKMHLNTKLLRVDANTLQIEKNSEITNLTYKGLIWTAGSKPCLLPGMPGKISKDGRICIDSKFHVIGLNDVFAIGDIAIDMDNPIPATAQGAMQQADFLAKNLFSILQGNSTESFAFIDQGEMLSLGIGNATITGYGLTLSGSIAFKLRRITYLSKMPTISLGIRSASAWLIENGKNFI